MGKASNRYGVSYCPHHQGGLAHPPRAIPCTKLLGGKKGVPTSSLILLSIRCLLPSRSGARLDTKVGKRSARQDIRKYPLFGTAQALSRFGLAWSGLVRCVYIYVYDMSWVYGERERQACTVHTRAAPPPTAHCTQTNERTKDERKRASGLTD